MPLDNIIGRIPRPHLLPLDAPTQENVGIRIAVAEAVKLNIEKYSRSALKKRSAEGVTLAPKMIIEGILEEADMWLPSGASKSFKSWLFGAYLAICVANGLPFFGQQTRKCKVLWIVGENKEYYINKRLEMLERGNNIPENDNLIIVPLRKYVHEDGHILFEAILTLIKESECDLIIIDPIYTIQEGQENNNDDVKRCAKQVAKIINETGKSVVGVMHQPKGDNSVKSALDSIVGGGVWGRFCDGTASINQHKEEDCWALRFGRRDGGRALKPVAYQWVFTGNKEEGNEAAKIVIRDDLDPADLYTPPRKGKKPKAEPEEVNETPAVKNEPSNMELRIAACLPKIRFNTDYKTDVLWMIIEEACDVQATVANKIWVAMRDTYFTKKGKGTYRRIAAEKTEPVETDPLDNPDNY